MAEINHCMYFVKRKKRYCRMTVKKGNKYCGEHRNPSEPNLTEEEKALYERVQCPLDPSHTCYLSKLSKHLKVCNAKRLLDEQPAFIVKGINLHETRETVQHIPLSELSESVINAVINKVNAAYGKLPQFPDVVLQHEVLKDKLNEESCGRAVRKHLMQNSSLLAHLERVGLVQDDTCFIEFGAGKGKLTYWLGQIIKDTKNSCILLVDRSSHRHKSDNKLKNEQLPVTVKRIRADIADLKLNNVAGIEKFENKVGIAKHLCGAATDLTISCLVRAMQCEPKCNVNGLVIAFCCHHRCEYAPYVGKQYLEECGFTPNEFTILCSIASWATCGTGLSRVTQIQNNDNAETRMDVQSNINEREYTGRKVKTLLNWGRLEYLRSVGFQSDLLYYTTTDITLENMCIITKKFPV